MNLAESIEKISGEIRTVLRKVKEEDIQYLLERIENAPRIFIYGEGRTGLVGRMFAVRLMHFGKDVYFVGETLTPAFQRDDLLLILSGLANRERIVDMAVKARKLGGEVVSITGNPSAPLYKSCHYTVLIPQSLKSLSESVSSQPLNSLFEQVLFFVLEGIVNILYDRLRIDDEEMFARHFNL
ncbi:MAG: SIS domain-containing protein [Caldiserica bacterium]|nr:SIS domain-containing protein [Caldisericota bacterium]